jgi:hypothetical protein
MVTVARDITKILGYYFQVAKDDVDYLEKPTFQAGVR